MSKNTTYNKRTKRKRLNFGSFLFVFFVAVLAICTIGVAALCIFTEPVDSSLLNIKMSSVIYYEDENGDKVVLQNLFDDENRTWVDYQQIPLDMKNAFVAIEDERFFQHPGFDPKRLAGAVLNSALRLVNKNRSVYGGSTITQQLVKNLTGDNEQSARRKLQEIYRAIRLEMDLSKNEILELYLNTIYLSQNCNGVATASRTYFAKNVSDLSLAECACIAGITQYPTKYDPYINPEANKEKQLLVLDKMLELEMITQDEHDEAAAEKLSFKADENARNAVYSYYVDTVIDDVLYDLETEYHYSEVMAKKMLYTGGLRIKCTIDPAIQETLESVYTDEKNKLGTDELPLQSAMVILDGPTGEIKGVIGGLGEKSGSRVFNRATALRQPGSTIKPIGVYAPALEYGVISGSSTINDTKTTFTLGDGTKWTPRNSGNSFSGNVSLKTAIAKSLNVPAVKTLDELGINKSFDFLSDKLGITSLVESRKTENGVVTDKALAALSLGGLTDGISTVQLAGAYLPFINDGIFIEPHTYTEIYDFNEELLFTNHPDTHRAMKSSTATLMINLLRAVVTSGTGRSAYFAGPELAGKTGTTTNDYDRWFVGITPEYIGVTWVGYDTPKRIQYSGNPAIPLWKSVMSQLDYENVPTSFSKVVSTSNVHYQTLCTVSGKKAIDICKEKGTTYSVLVEKGKSGVTGSCSPSYHEETIEPDTDTNEDNPVEQQTPVQEAPAQEVPAIKSPAE